MRALFRFLSSSDSSALRAGLLSGAMFLTVAGVFAAGRLGWLPDYAARLLVELRHWQAGPSGPFWVGLAFLAGAFLGAPQFVLIGASVGLFGPVTGGIYAWAATLASALMTFLLGRWGGAGALARFGGAAITRFAGLAAKNGFMTAFLIRNVPSGPFIMVNMVMGAAGMRALPYVLGTALGIVPKIVLIALAGGTVNAAAQGAIGLAAGLTLLAGGVWVAMIVRAPAGLRPGTVPATTGPVAESPEPVATDQVAPPR